MTKVETDHETASGFLVCLLFFLVVAWLTFTLLSWMMPWEGHPTLVQVLAAQCHGLKSLRIW